MANSIRITTYFLKKAKRLVKKYATLQESLKHLEKALIINPKIGDNYGSNIYKIRLADEFKGKGKSGGFRVVTYIIEKTSEVTNVYLITIFDKSEESSIYTEDIKAILRSEGIL